MKESSVFNTFIDDIKSRVSNATFQNWFSVLEPISCGDDKWVIKVPMNVYKNILSTTYKSVIESTMMDCFDKKMNIEYVTQDELDNLNTIDNNNDNIEVLEEDEWNSNLKEEYTFDTFVVGDSNKFAAVSARNVAENPGKIQNPLFIYGQSGLGKTHLMMAIGNYITSHSNKKVLYVTSAEFKEDISLFADNTVNKIEYAQKFKQKYKQVDVLLIDDIQFLVDTHKSQEEFFNIFNSLYQANKQIIISSDRSPDDLKKIEDRLRSRFKWGLSVDIYPPDYNLRCKIIKSMLKNTDFENKLSEDIIDYIANMAQSDVRYIIGTIKRLMAYTAMMLPDKIDLKFVSEALNDYGNYYSDNSVSKIQKVVADYFKITVADLKSKKRTINIANPRHIAIYLSKMHTDATLAEIGLQFGGKDHSTISASIKKITNDLKTDNELNEMLKNIQSKL